MRKIGLLYGMENSFPQALIDEVNGRKVPNVTAEFIRLGPVKAGQAPPYRVIIDRVSIDIDFYAAYLKNAAVNGTHVINNPFRWSADDKFYTCSLAAELGLTVPKTAVIPQKMHPPGTTVQSMRNLEFPLNWDDLFSYVGFPAYLKTVDGRVWANTSKVGSADEFFRAYDQTGSACMLLQEAIENAQFFRCYVIGQQQVRVMNYDRQQPHRQRYSLAKEIAPALCDRLVQDSIKLSKALAYDLNCLEFAVCDGVPYGIDFFNPVPDVDEHAIGTENFQWVVKTLADYAITKAQSEERPQTDSRWRTRMPAATAVAG